MAAGRYRERIEIQAKTLVDDGMGGFEETWATVSTVWGRTWGATGSERRLASMEQGEVSRHFEIRYYAGLTEANRVVFDGQSYNVKFVNHIKHEGKTFFDGKALTDRSAN